MNRNTFTNVMTQIDDKYIDEITIKRADLRATEAATKPKLLLRTLPIAAALAVIISAALGIFTLSNRTKDPIPSGGEPSVVPPVSDVGNTTEEEGSVTPPEDKYTNTLVEGAYKLTPPSHSSKQPYFYAGSVRINAFSYYLKSEEIYIDVSYGFAHYEYADKYADLSNPITRQSIPTFSVYNYIEEGGNSKPTPLINGSVSKYQKQFPQKEGTPYLGYVPGYDDDGVYIQYYNFKCSEKIGLNFSDLEVGTTGAIFIVFNWVYTDTDKVEPGSGLGYFLYYYVGENGVGFSMFSLEDAIDNLNKIESTELSHPKRYF